MMKMHELLDAPEKWTKQSVARNWSGFDLSYARSPHAVCWCLLGAISKCYPPSFILPEEGQLTREEVSRRIEAAIKKRTGREIAIDDWNDNAERTFDEVREMLLELDI